MSGPLLPPAPSANARVSVERAIPMNGIMLRRDGVLTRFSRSNHSTETFVDTCMGRILDAARAAGYRTCGIDIPDRGAGARHWFTIADFFETWCLYPCCRTRDIGRRECAPAPILAAGPSAARFHPVRALLSGLLPTTSREADLSASAFLEMLSTTAGRIWPPTNISTSSPSSAPRIADATGVR